MTTSDVRRPGHGQGSSWRQRAAAVLAAALLVLVGSWSLAGPASAHAQLVSSDPADGSTLSAAPAHVTLKLSESVVSTSLKVVLTDGTGRTVPVTATHVTATAAGDGPGLIRTAGDKRVPTTVVLDLPVLGPDVYHLAWQTLSADDLHVTSGVVVFGVQRDVVGEAGQVDDPLPSAAEVALRWAQLLSAALAAGAGAIALLAVGAIGAPLRRRLLLVVCTGSVAVLALQALLLLEQSSAGASSVAALLGSSYGARWLAHAAFPLVAGVWASIGLRRVGDVAHRSRPALAGVLALVLGYGLTSSLLGHTGNGGPVELLLDAVHVGAALLWVGSVATLVLVVWPLVASADLRRHVLQVVGRLATVCLALMVVTGVALSGRSVASLDAALLSTYGRTLLVKLALVAVVLAAAWRVRTQVRSARPARFVRVEAVALLAVLVGAAALASTRPAIGTQWQPQSAVAPLAAGQVEDLVESMTVSPNRPGRNFVTVDVYETRRPSPGPVTQVSVTFSRQGQPTQTLRLAPQGTGRWLAPTDVLASAGGWDVKILVDRDGLPSSVATYGWTVADPAARLAKPVVSSAPLGSLMDLVAGVLGLIGLLVVAGAVIGVRRRSMTGTAAVKPIDEARDVADEAESGNRDGDRSPARC